MLIRFIQFSASGFTTFLFDLFLIYILITFTSLHYTIAIALSFLTATSLHYLINYLWVFKDSSQTLLKGYVLFFFFTFFSVTSVVVFTMIGVEFFFLPILIARTGASIIMGIANFLLNYYLNFKPATLPPISHT